MTLSRRHDWRVRLEEAIDAIFRTPFDWESQHDCAMALAARSIEAVTGVDLGASWRGRYRSERGALRLMRQQGFDDLADLAAAHLPEHLTADGSPWVAIARTGDIAAVPVDTPFRSSLGVVNGERILVLRPEGMGTVDLLQAQRAFRVG